MTLNTRDIGIIIRDFVEGEKLCGFEEVDGELEPTKDWHSVEVVDVSDPNNPLIVLDNGQQFRIQIFLEG